VRNMIYDAGLENPAYQKTPSKIRKNSDDSETLISHSSL
jgi:hypothetical protein